MDVCVGHFQIDGLWVEMEMEMEMAMESVECLDAPAKQRDNEF